MKIQLTVLKKSAKLVFNWVFEKMGLEAKKRGITKAMELHSNTVS